MSSNDGLLISKSTFKVFHYDADGGYCNEVAQGKDLEEAIKLSEEWEEKTMYPVEYGLRFIK